MSTDRWDARARQVAALPYDEWRDRGRALDGDRLMEWYRARMRWDVGLFAAMIMGPSLGGQSGIVSEPNEVDDYVYGLEPLRAGQRGASTRRLLMTGRGIGKSTRLKIRALHGLLYGWSRVGLAVGANDDEAQSWVSPFLAWIGKPPPRLAALFPEAEIKHRHGRLETITRFGTSYLLARGFTTGLRGINVDLFRPDALYLDDIEGEDKSRTEAARDANQARLQSKVLPLAPIEGGAETWWVQTPVDPDAVAVRAWQGTHDLTGWSARRIPVVRKWPESPEAVQLWAENRRIYDDVDTYGDDQRARQAAAVAHFEAHRETMSEGAEVLDPQRLPIDAAYRLRWDVGETAWATEYDVRPTPAGTATFEPDLWPTFRRVGDRIVYRGKEHSISGMELTAHLDTSDGGDAGAIVLVGRLAGRVYVVDWHVWEGIRLSRQIAETGGIVAPWARWGLSALQWEPTPGSASLVLQRLEGSLRDAGVRIPIIERHSTERKEARIVATLEPLGASGQLTIAESLPGPIKVKIGKFDPVKRGNPDDFLDALQRAVEQLEGSKQHTSGADALALLRRARGR